MLNEEGIYSKFKYTPSKYQQQIIDKILNTNENILVNAKAGSGKTSTLLMIAECLKYQDKKSLFLAFNKSIVEELKTKVDTSYCSVKTLHSLGFSYIASYLYSKYKTDYKLEVDNNYFKDIIEYYFQQYCGETFSASLEASFCSNLKETVALKRKLIDKLEDVCNFLRFYNIDYYDIDKVVDLAEEISEECINSNLYGMDKYPLVIKHSLDKVLELFNNPEFDGSTPIYKINFVDMIWFPCIFDMRCPYSYKDIKNILIDESQDINILEQILIKKFLKSNSDTRFIFVGDKFQSIYGFAGADVHSIDNITNNFKLTSLPLNICYRCPKNIITLAQSIVPDIEVNPDRKDLGNIYVLPNKDLYKYLEPNDILVRKN